MLNQTQGLCDRWIKHRDCVNVESNTVQILGGEDQREEKRKTFQALPPLFVTLNRGPSTAAEAPRSSRWRPARPARDVCTWACGTPWRPWCWAQASRRTTGRSTEHTAAGTLCNCTAPRPPQKALGARAPASPVPAASAPPDGPPPPLKAPRVCPYYSPVASQLRAGPRLWSSHSSLPPPTIWFIFQEPFSIVAARKLPGCFGRSFSFKNYFSSDNHRWLKNAARIHFSQIILRVFVWRKKWGNFSWKWPILR